MIRILVSLFLFSAVLISCQNSPNDKKEYLEHVGNTVFDAEIDTAQFKPCHEDQILEYYNFTNGLQYDGEKITIDKVFREKYSYQKTEGQTGYVTIRFVVNCMAKTGWFRIEEMDNDYKVKSFNKDLVEQLIMITQSLKGWKIGKFDDPGYENEVYDYYQYLTFKLNDGQIIEILP